MLRNHRTAGRLSHSTATTTNPREPREGTNTGGRSRRQTLGASLFKSLEQHSSAYYLGGQASTTSLSSTRTTTALGARQDKACLSLHTDENTADRTHITPSTISPHTTPSTADPTPNHDDLRDSPTDHHRTHIDTESILDSHHQQQLPDSQASNRPTPLPRPLSVRLPDHVDTPDSHPEYQYRT